MDTRSAREWAVSRGTMFVRILEAGVSGEVYLWYEGLLTGATAICGLPAALAERLVELGLAVCGETLPE
jgi:hypothetical protein